MKWSESEDFFFIIFKTNPKAKRVKGTSNSTSTEQFYLGKLLYQSSFLQNKPPDFIPSFHCLCVMQISLHASWQLCDLMAGMWQGKKKRAQSKAESTEERRK